MMTTRARVTCSQNDVAGKLVFDINVELLDSALLEIKILGLNGSSEGSGIWL